MSVTLAIDPGETTGWSIWRDRRKLDGGQTPWDRFALDLAYCLDIGEAGSVNVRPSGMGPRAPFAIHGPITRIIVEDFVLYPEGVGDGPPPPWDQLITARLVGAIWVLAELTDVELVFQGANCKDAGAAALGDDGLARPLHENRHENDASFHGAYYFARNPEAT